MSGSKGRPDTTGARAPRRYVPALRFRWLTRIYDPLIRVTTREARFKARLLELAELEHAVSALDIGCGTGTFAVMAKAARPGLTVVGLDADPEVLDIARAKARAAGAHIDLVEGSADQLPVADRSFDRVVSSLFFHHLDRATKGRVASELFRVLSPGGQLHVADWGVPSSFVMRAAFVSVQLLDGFANTNDNVRGELPRIFEDAGFWPVEERERMTTMYGTLAWYSAGRPDVQAPPG